MRIRTCIPVILTALLLALASCDGAPVAPEAKWLDVEVQLTAKAAPAPPAAGRSQCVNNLKQIGLGLNNRPLAHITAPSQVVDQEGRSVRIHAQYDMYPTVQHDQGEASPMCGSARLDGPEDEEFWFWPIWGTLQVERDGRIVVRYEGEAEICSERECETVAIVGMIEQAPTDAEATWQFHVGDDYASAFPVRTQFVFPGPGK